MPSMRLYLHQLILMQTNLEVFIYELGNDFYNTAGRAG